MSKTLINSLGVRDIMNMIIVQYFCGSTKDRNVCSFGTVLFNSGGEQKSSPDISPDNDNMWRGRKIWCCIRQHTRTNSWRSIHCDVR